MLPRHVPPFAAFAQAHDAPVPQFVAQLNVTVEPLGVATGLSGMIVGVCAIEVVAHINIQTNNSVRISEKLPLTVL